MYLKVIAVLKLSNCCDYLGRIRGCDSTSCCLWVGLGDVILPLVVAFGVGLAGSSCWKYQRVLISKSAYRG